MTPREGSPALRRFARGEDGSMVVFSLFLLIMMLIVAGMGVDFVRYESTRARLQTTLDRAVLAAASLRQEADPEEVVRDYFRTAGLEGSLGDVTVTDRFNERTVAAQATVQMNTIFLPLAGIDTLLAPASGAATEAELDLEIILVLDVSGSMQDHSRLLNLKLAAKEFVATMIGDYDPGRVSIGIVPFNGQVNLGPDLVSLYNVSDRTAQPNDDCVDLPSGVYSSRIVPADAILSATGYADTFSSTQQTGYTTSQRTPNLSNLWCPSSTANVVQLPTTNVGRLQARIDGLAAIGATSINAGMRWGTTLLDPMFRPQYATLISRNAIEAGLTGHPFDYETPNLMKIVVVMTDGSHFPEERVATAYKSGASPIYRSTGDGNFSIHHPDAPGANRYWVPHLGTWQAQPYNSGAGTSRLNWPDVWSTMRMSYVAWQFYARAKGSLGQSTSAAYDAQIQAFRSQTSITAMDAQLQAVCRQARQQGVTVFGIAFEAPAAGREQIALCAGTPANYYDASGLEIRDAFRSIANRIKSLRLIQ